MNNLSEKTTGTSVRTRQETDPAKPQVKFDIIDIAYESKTKSLGKHISEYEV
jgi:hypothetical protein